MTRLRLLVAVAALAACADAAQAGPEQPPPPWFVVADIPSHDPAFTTTRWLWSREDRALRYCRKPADKPDWTCAADAVLPDARTRRRAAYLNGALTARWRGGRVPCGARGGWRSA